MGIFDPNIDRLKKTGNAAGLIKALSNKNLLVAERAAAALGEVGGPGAAKALVDAYKGGKIRRKTALASLAGIGNPEGANALARLIAGEDWEKQRWEISKEIEAIGVHRVPSGGFWYGFCSSASTFGDARFAEDARKSVDALLVCLGSPDMKMRKDALKVIRELDLPHDQKIASAVARQLDERKNELYMVQDVVRILGGYESKSYVQLFFKCLDSDFLGGFVPVDEDSSQRFRVFSEAVAAIGKVCDVDQAKRILPILERQLKAGKGENETMATFDARNAYLKALVSLLADFFPVEVLRATLADPYFDDDKLKIAKSLVPESIPDDLIPTLAKRPDSPFARELLRKKGSVAAKELVRRFMAEKDAKALGALAGMKLDAEVIVSVVGTLALSGLDAIEEAVAALAGTGDRTINAYKAVLAKDWAALRTFGKDAAGAAAAVVSKGALGSVLEGKAGELFEVLADLDFETAYSAFYDLPPGDDKDAALAVVLKKAPSPERREKIADAAISSLIGAIKSPSLAGEVKMKAAESLKKLHARGGLSDAMKQRIVDCRGMVVYKEHKNEESGHYDDCLTSGPPPWHTDRANHYDSYVDVRFDI